MNANGEWAIVELMGHRTRAGWCCEVERFGAKMLRIDIPHPEKQEEVIGTEPLRETPIKRELFEATQFYSGSAIFSYTPCAEEVVRRQRASYAPPVRYQLPACEPEWVEEAPDSSEQEAPERGP